RPHNPVTSTLNDTCSTPHLTPSLHDALPISPTQAVGQESAQHRGTKRSKQDDQRAVRHDLRRGLSRVVELVHQEVHLVARHRGKDRKSTRLNSSHVSISYAVFCLKKKKELTE